MKNTKTLNSELRKVLMPLLDKNEFAEADNKILIKYNDKLYSFSLATNGIHGNYPRLKVCNMGNGDESYFSFDGIYLKENTGDLYWKRKENRTLSSTIQVSGDNFKVVISKIKIYMEFMG